MHYDGTSWTQVAAPSLGPGVSELNGIAVRGLREIFAVGGHSDASGNPGPLVLRYDGSTWTRVPSAWLAVGGEWFGSVNATASGDYWAVGGYNNGSNGVGLTERLSAGGTVHVVPGTGCPGAAQIAVRGVPLVGTIMTLASPASCGSAGAPGIAMLVVGVQSLALPIAGCSGTCVLATVPIAVASAPTRISFSFKVPNDPNWIGTTIIAQTGCFGSGSGACLHLDTAVRVLLR